MQASVITTGVAEELQDPNNERWALTDLLRYLSGAQRAVALVRPDATARTQVVTLAAGTKQSIPATSARLLSVVRNMGSDGSTPGRPIALVERSTLDEFNPEWHSQTAKSVVDEYVYDPKNPKTYYVNPPITGTVQIEIVASDIPTELASVSDALAVDDIYEAALREWTLYLAYSLNQEQRNHARATQHANTFFSLLGTKTRSDMMVAPSSKEGAS